MPSDFSRNSNPPSNSVKWIERELDKLDSDKADDSRVNGLEKVIDETKKIAVSARDRAKEPHTCMQLDTLNEIKKELQSWKNVKVISFVGIIVAIVTAASFLGSLNNSVKSNEQAVTEVKQTVKNVESSQQKLDLVVKEDQKVRREEEGQRMSELKNAIQSIVNEVRKDNTERTANSRIR